MAIGQTLSLSTRFQKTLTEALAFASVVGKFKVSKYNEALSKLSDLHVDQKRLRG